MEDRIRGDEPSAGEVGRLVPTRLSKPAMAGAVLLAIAILGTAGTFGFKVFSARLEAARKLDRATELLQSADEIVVAVDKVVRAPASKQLAEQARGALTRVDQADAMLTETAKLLTEAHGALNDDERERAELVRDCTLARQRMLDQAPVILMANAQAASALPLAERGWRSLTEAVDICDKAVTAYNKLTRTGVQESKRLNVEAASKLSYARSRFDAAENAFPAAPFERYVAYVDARNEMATLSTESDNAWLSNAMNKANKAIAQYNKKDKSAVKQAKKLPATPQKAVSDAYKQMTEKAASAYFKAREDALAADKSLKAY